MLNSEFIKDKFFDKYIYKVEFAEMLRIVPGNLQECYLFFCRNITYYGQTNEKYKENSRKSSTAGRKPITYSRASNFGSKNEM